MIKEVIASGKTVVEAQENARALLGAGPLDDVSFQIVHAGSKGIFGIIGVKPAQVKASMEVADETPRAERRARPERPQKQHTERPEGASEGTKAPKNKKKKKKPQQPQKKAPEAQSVAVADSELKMERMEVAEGEDLSFELVKTLIADLGLNAEAEL